MSIKDKQIFTREEAIKQVRAMANLFGLMFYHYANLAEEELGEEKGRAFVEEAVKRFGLERAERVKIAVEAKGMEPTLENRKKANILDLPQIGWGGIPEKHSAHLQRYGSKKVQKSCASCIVRLTCGKWLDTIQT